MFQIRLSILVCIIVSLPLTARADIDAEMKDASIKLSPVLRQAETLVADGRADEANQKILAVFPEASRTAVESLMLGNVLFKQNSKLSYALHKSAAAELANEPDAQFEWALEQHRAGEFAGAIEAYARFSAANPNFAPVYGLAAECLIRTGKIREAVEMWQRSEKATDGSLETLESLVCEVHSATQLQKDRADYFTKAKAGDIAAAEKLIALDVNFPRDWWNAGPHPTYLERDVHMLQATKFTDSKRLPEILCAAEAAMMGKQETGDVADLLRQRGFFFNAANTLPQNGALLSAMLAAALERDAIKPNAARSRWGEAILAKARTTKDVEMFNAAANLFVGTERIAAIDQQGWDATGDPRFAASLLTNLAGEGTLTLDDPRVVKAVKQFPENAEIARVVVMLTTRAKKPMQPALIQAIKAEYTHFSIGQALLPRPSAKNLRAYFTALGKELPAR